MKIKEAVKILNVSHMTIHNWIKSGKLKLNKVLPNGYRDINEESVYDMVASTYEPDKNINRVIVFSSDGKRRDFKPDEVTTQKVIEYLSEKSKII